MPDTMKFSAHEQADRAPLNVQQDHAAPVRDDRSNGPRLPKAAPQDRP